MSPALLARVKAQESGAGGKSIDYKKKEWGLGARGAVGEGGPAGACNK